MNNAHQYRLNEYLYYDFRDIANLPCLDLLSDNLFNKGNLNNDNNLKIILTLTLSMLLTTRVKR